MEKEFEITKLLELYSICVENNNNNDQFDMMDSLPPEDERWLMEAIRSGYIDPTEKMKENINFIRGNITNRTTDNQLTQCIDAIKQLQDITENLDFASDFVKFGGLNLIEDLLLDQNVKIQCESSALLGNVNQNNLFCQSESINRNIIETLVVKLSEENDARLQKKLIYALSCTVRGNPNGFERFIQINGFDLLLFLLQTASESAIKCKVAFFIYCLCTESDINNIGYRKIEFCIDNIISCLINMPSLSVLEAEHLLGSLCSLIKSYPSINFQRQVELAEFLQTQLQDLNHAEAEEIVFYTIEILTTLHNRNLALST